MAQAPVPAGRFPPSRSFLPPALLLLVCGILAAVAFRPETFWAAAVLAILATVWIAAMAGRQSVAALILAGSSVFCLGFLLASLQLGPPGGPGDVGVWADRPCLLEGTVVGTPRDFDGGRSVTVDCARLQEGGSVRRVRGRVRLWIYGEGEDGPAWGDTVRAEVTPRRPWGKRFPGDFNQRLSLAAEDVRLTAGVEAGPRLAVISGRAPWWWRPVEHFRKRTSLLLRETDYPVRGLLEALLIGRRGRLDEGVEEDFRRSGLAHILSVSGLHVGLMGLAAYFSLLWLLRLGHRLTSRMDVRRPAAVCGVPLVIFYTLVTGSQPPAVRSAVMVVIFLMALAAGRSSDQMTSLLLAALVLLLVSPLVLLLASFQLSFAAALAIVLTVKACPRLFGGESPGGAWWSLKGAGRYLAVSAAAFAGTFPLTTYYFSLVAPSGLVANVAAIPIFTYAILPFGLAAGALATVSLTAAKLVLVPAVWGGQLMIWLARIVAQAGFLHFRGWHLSPAQVTIIYIVFLALLIRRRRAGKLLMGAAVAGYLAATLVKGPLGGGGKLAVTFLDVGQGDACLVALPDGRSLLVDAGGSYGSRDRGTRVVIPCLRAKGIHRLGCVVVTHDHPDHVGGLSSVLREVPAGKIILNRIPRAESLMNWGLKGSDRRLAVRGRGDREELGSASLLFWHPLRDDAGAVRTPAEGEANDDSLVFTCVAARGSVLFAGDAGGGVLGNLAAGFGPRLEADLLKVPHHGSRHSRSEEFYRAVRPRAAVISVGRNPFGHPDDALLADLARLGIESHVTGRDGTVEYLFGEDGCREALWSGRDDRPSPWGLGHWFFTGW